MHAEIKKEKLEKIGEFIKHRKWKKKGEVHKKCHGSFEEPWYDKFIDVTLFVINPKV